MWEVLRETLLWNFDDRTFFHMGLPSPRPASLHWNFFLFDTMIQISVWGLQPWQLIYQGNMVCFCNNCKNILNFSVFNSKRTLEESIIEKLNHVFAVKKKKWFMYHLSSKSTLAAVEIASP